MEIAYFFKSAVRKSIVLYTLSSTINLKLKIGRIKHLLHKNLAKVAGIGLLSVLALTGCDRRTPEERLESAIGFYQQQPPDTLSAETEALKIIDKSPDDPAATQAHLLLATIYRSDNRLDESLSQYEQVLAKVSQTDSLGRDTLRMYLEALQQAGNFKEAIAVTEKYQKEYAKDDGTSLSLIVGRADIMTNAGETTGARAILTSLIKETTGPAENNLYRQMVTKTYLREGNTTEAINYLEGELPTVHDEDSKRNIISGLSQLYTLTNNYDKVRSFLKLITEDTEKSISGELDTDRKLSYALGLAMQYNSVGNLVGAQKTFETIYNTGVSNPQFASHIVQALTANLLSQRETSAALNLLKDADKKYPELQFSNALTQIESMISEGKLDAAVPQNTAPLTLKFRADEPLFIQNLEQLLKPNSAGTTTGTQAAAPATTGTVEIVHTQTETTSTQ